MALSMMVFFNKLQKNPFVSQILEQEKKKQFIESFGCAYFKNN